MVHREAGQLSREAINAYYFIREFDAPGDPLSQVKFGTSGHRGRLGGGFCRLHAQSIAQAVARLHGERGIKGPILVGGDTRLMSAETAKTCAEVLAGNGLQVQLAGMPLPTPVFSLEIIAGRAGASLNGTASHNPPHDMGLKYNPPSGGPAGAEYTAVIEKYANECLRDPRLIRRLPLAKAKAQGLVTMPDLVGPYLKRLGEMVDLEILRKSGLRIGIHPLGGSSVPYYEGLRRDFGLKNLRIVDKNVDPTFGFIPRDHDGQIRMDPSSPYPMKPLLDLAQAGRFDFVGASDPDADRFGVATKTSGLLTPNEALCVLLAYLLEYRPSWPKHLCVGRTIGTTHLLDRIARAHGREVDEVNVGFKWYVEGIRSDKYLLAGEESAGLSVYQWTAEKDGILAVLLLAEAMARTGKDLRVLYQELTARHGSPAYRRVDVAIDESQRAKIKSMKGAALKELKELAGRKVVDVRDTDGIKVYLEDAWILARLSGTEPIAKLYGESFQGPEHLGRLLKEGGALFGLRLD
ncbi:MAG TPA: alpha-D-glucose phosphate-specific phosphoglucomutase [Elusimicrobia bacterium]|nr:alpha-D-glucose phosphate-specific phosphoglucomutase [Elusimicrobiota bacterium]HBT60645.1 alpha-D-glucose phosphate-specific phosphoglucomutase [Elusimicrobiota bacterium]